MNRVSFEAQEGEFLSLIGPFGCGKSTLPAMMDGVLTPDSGSFSSRATSPTPGWVPAPRCSRASRSWRGSPSCTT
ncbi:ATP-binding cassette domain-containing protein [Streptomyces sp. NBC_01003]|uniref:ATP-binding cassette domain-containing protein n=1 Tax=Streptomyces sp. NBC_01003 TaxID=2903714 RepID=UPI0038700322